MTGLAYAETEPLRATIPFHAPAPAGMIIFRPDNRTAPMQAVHDIQDAALLQLVKSGNFDARQKLVTGNLRLVLNGSRGYARNGAGIFDLLKAGNRGLVHALENYVPENDDSFSEYAGQCIRQHIEQVLRPAPQRLAACKQDGHSGHQAPALRQCA